MHRIHPVTPFGLIGHSLNRSLLNSFGAALTLAQTSRPRMRVNMHRQGTNDLSRLLARRLMWQLTSRKALRYSLRHASWLHCDCRVSRFDSYVFVRALPPTLAPAVEWDGLSFLDSRLSSFSLSEKANSGRAQTHRLPSGWSSRA